MGNSVTEGIFGLVGVVIGAILAFGGQVWIEHRNRSRRAYYLAVRIVCMLDEFVEDCLVAAHDEGEVVHDNGYEELIPTAPSAKVPQWPVDADWESFDPDLLHRVLTFPAKVKSANEMISQTAEYVDSPPDHIELFEEKSFQHATLGLSACELAKAIRSKYKIPKTFSHLHEPEEALDQIEKKVTKDRQARHEHFAKMTGQIKINS